MDTTEALNRFGYDQWATARQFEVVTTLGKDQYEMDLGSSHGGICGTLVHIYGAQEIWFARWKRSSPTIFPTVSDVPNIAVLQHKWQALRSEIREFITGLNE